MGATELEPPDCILYKPDGRFRKEEAGKTAFTGRGVAVRKNGSLAPGKLDKAGCMVLIAHPGYEELEVMVSYDDFKERLYWKCPHGLKGWSCKKCLEGEEVRKLV